MERLVRLAAVLHNKGTDGVSANRLVVAAGFEGAGAHDQLLRELRHLRNAGWQIDNIAPEGEDARYRMTSIDSRLRVQLTDAQQAALRRAVLLTDRAGLADRLGLPPADVPESVASMLSHESDDAALEIVLRAVRQHCLLHFHYNGADRAVHPVSVLAVNQGWQLHCVEDGDDRVKVFVVSRMTGLYAGSPGSAHAPRVVDHPSPNPLMWAVDEPVDVTVTSATQFAPDVRHWLGTATSESTTDDTTTFTYRVTNRSGLRARLYQLGSRVNLIGPPDVRAELLDELSMMAGE